MEDLKKEIIDYRTKNSYSIDECAKKLKIDVDTLTAIENGTAKLSNEEKTRLKELVSQPKPKSGKRIVKILDLIFRFGATIMGLVVLLLCINGYSETQTLIALLSVGVVCSAFIMLPKIDK